MKKYLIFLFAAAFIFAGCSDDKSAPDIVDPKPDPDEKIPEPEPEPKPEENPYKTGDDMSCSLYIDWEDLDTDDYSVLGYGYDATGKFAHPVSVRKKMYDLEAYKEDYKSNLSVFGINSHQADYFFWGDETECKVDIAKNASSGFTSDEISRYKNLFKEALIPVFDNDNVFPDIEYAYYGFSGISRMYKVFFGWFAHSHKDKYLTEEFKDDLNNRTAEEILELYGTHMITGLYLGQRIDYIYRTTSSDIDDIQNWGIYYANYFIDSGEAPNKPEIDPPLKDNMYIEFVSGFKPDPNAYMIDILNYEGGRFRFEGQEELTNTFVGFAEKLVPIYRLVTDPVKSEELQNAFEVYMGAVD